MAENTSNLILPTGHGGVQVVITDTNNNPIIDPVSEMPVGELVTSFSYLYDEEDDDECTIIISCQNPDLADIPQFRDQQYILVQWGATYSNGGTLLSPPRKVMVRDVTVAGNSDSNVTITLECTDGFSIMKRAAIGARDNNNLLEWIESSLSGKYKTGFYIVDAKEARGATMEEWREQYYSLTPSYNLMSHVPKEKRKKANVDYSYVAPPDTTKEVKMDQLVKTRLVIQTGKTPYNTMKDAIKTIPNGPYHLDTRDDTINVKPVNFNQPPVATFVWKQPGSEIISFSVATRKTPKSIDVVSDENIDGTTKTISHSVTQSNAATPKLEVDGITGETIPSDIYADVETTKKQMYNDLVKQNAQQYLDQTMAKYNSSTSNPTDMSNIGLEPMVVKVNAKVKEKVNARDYDTSSGRLSPTGADKDSRGWDQLQRDKNVIVVSPQKKGDEGWQTPEVLVDKEFEVQLQPADLLGVAGDSSVVNTIALNNLNEALQNQVEMDLSVIGQPYLVCGRIITINNISKRYSGDWYIKSVEHRIDISSGYICDIEAIKKTSSNGTIAQSTITTNTSSINAKIQAIAEKQKAGKGGKKEVASTHEQLFNEFRDYGQVTIINDEDGNPREVRAESDWVNVTRETETDRVNSTDKKVQDYINKE